MSWAGRVYGQVPRGTYRQLRISFLGNTDAPQMTKSIRPNFAMVSSTAFFRAAGWRTSAAAARHFPPVAFSSFDALSASPFALQSASTSRAPRQGGPRGGIRQPSQRNSSTRRDSLSTDDGCAYAVSHHRLGDLVADSTSTWHQFPVRQVIPHRLTSCAK